ncbi:MAG TPA: Uma2 family endonuclease [Nitriliruptorales bacterium]
MSATVIATGLTYDDIKDRPEEVRQLVDGELIVTPSPNTRHQRVALWLAARFHFYAHDHPGEAFVAPFDVRLDDRNVFQPDVLYLRDPADRLTDALVDGPPDLVIEVSSPSTRRLDLVRKRRHYEAHGVPEFWFVDLDADRVAVYRLTDGRYTEPTFAERGDVLTALATPDLALDVDALLGEPRSG